MKKQWKDIKNSYFQKNVFRQLKRKQEFLWTKLLKWDASPQNWKNVNNSNKFKSWKLQEKNWKQTLESEKKIVKNMKQSLKKVLIQILDFDVEKNQWSFYQITSETRI